MKELHLIMILPPMADWFETLSYRGELKSFDKAKNEEEAEKKSEQIRQWTEEVDDKLDNKK